MERIYQISAFRVAISQITDEMIILGDALTEIDSKLGDGDMGMSMEKAARAIQQTMQTDTSEQPGRLLMQCAMACNRAAPSTLGTLLSIGMMAVGKAMGTEATVNEALIVRIPTILADAIALRGKAIEGDKTILEALYPYARALQSTYHASGDLATATKAATLAAVEGMEATKGKVAKIGRAKWLAERNMEYPDGGAFLFSKIAERLCPT